MKALEKAAKVRPKMGESNLVRTTSFSIVHVCECGKLLWHCQCGRGDQSLPNEGTAGSNNQINANFTKEKIVSFCSLRCQDCSRNLPTLIIFFKQDTALTARHCSRDWHSGRTVLTWCAHLHITCSITSVICRHHMGLTRDPTCSTTQILVTPLWAWITRRGISNVTITIHVISGIASPASSNKTPH